MTVLVALISSCVNSGLQKNSEVELPQSIPDQSDTADGTTKAGSLQVEAVIVNEARDKTLLNEVMSDVNDIYRQCGIEVKFDTKTGKLAAEQAIDSETRSNLAQQYKNVSPTMFFVPGTAEEDVAFAHLPSLNSPAASTIWITGRVNEGCLAWITAHEIGHVLLNSGKHSNGTGNVMSNGCTLSNWNNGAASPVWTTEQCSALHQSPSLK